MRRFIVRGMSCAACSSRVEKAVSKVPGVDSCSVSLLTSMMNVEGTAPDSEIIKAVTDAGYSAEAEGKKTEKNEDELKDRETPKLIKRLVISVAITCILMYF